MYRQPEGLPREGLVSISHVVPQRRGMLAHMSRETPSKDTYCYPYPRPAVTVDNVIFSMRASELVVLLIKRKSPPFEDRWALPGGFVDANESLARACSRELAEETGLTSVRAEQLGAFGDPGRDPRGHTVSIAYVSFIVAERALLKAGDDAADVAWHPLSHLAPIPSAAPKATRGRKKPVAKKKSSGKASIELAFDHRHIVDAAVTRLQERLRDPTRAASFDLVPPTFTLGELQRVYEVVYNRALDKRNFRAKILSARLVEPVGTARRGPHRPAQLYRWNLTSR